MIRFIPRDGIDAWTVLAAACALVVAVVATERMATVALEQLTAPYDLASEGPQLATIGVIRSGLNPYSPEVFNDYPFVLTFYTPLYYYVVNALAGKSDRVFTARATSLVCMIVAGCIPLLVARQRLPIMGVLATSVFFLFWPVTINAAFAKNDSMAILFGALAVWSAWRFPSSGGTIVSAALGLVSFMAKQSFVTAPISIAIYLAITDRRRLVIFLNATAGLGAITAMLCTSLFGAGFWTSLLAQRFHPISFATLAGNFSAVVEQPLIVVWVVAAVAIVGIGMQFVHDGGTIATSAYALVSSCLLLVFLGKAGASTNTVMEPMLALCIASVRCDRSASKLRGYEVKRAVIAAIIAIAALYDAAVVEPFCFNLTRAAFNADRACLAEERGEMLREVVGESPTILNLATPAHTGELPGYISLSDPYCQLLIYGAGGLSMNRLLAAVERRQYDAVVATPGMLRWLVDPRNNLTALADAVGRNYPLKRRSAGMIFFVRREEVGQ